jgi:hypothetical protein
MTKRRGGRRRTNVWRATGIKDESSEELEFMSLSEVSGEWSTTGSRGNRYKGREPGGIRVYEPVVESVVEIRGRAE